MYLERFSVENEHDIYGGQKKVRNMLRNKNKNVNKGIHINAVKLETCMDGILQKLIPQHGRKHRNKRTKCGRRR